MTYDKSCDPMDKLIADHIAEARDLCLHRRPAYAGMTHDFSAGFEHKMDRLRKHVPGEWLRRLILVAILTALCMMTVQAGFGGIVWNYTIKGSQWTDRFPIFDGRPAETQAADLTFCHLPKGYRLADRDYERSMYTYRFVYADEVLPAQDHFMTSLYVRAHWVGASGLSGSIHNDGLVEVETIRIHDSDALLLTDHSGKLELLFAESGFEITIYADRLDKAQLIAFAEGITLK